MNKIINIVAVIGIGNLCKQIAEWSASYGYIVNIYDINPNGLGDSNPKRLILSTK